MISRQSSSDATSPKSSILAERHDLAASEDLARGPAGELVERAADLPPGR
jgi:hypothetical protein